MNQILVLHKRINVGLGILCGFLIITIGLISMQNPIVVMMDDGQRYFLKAQRGAVSVGEPEIRRVVEEFIKSRYEWEALEPQAISKSMEPLVTSGLNKKIRAMLLDLKSKGLQGKEASQAVSGISISVTEKEIIAQFDKVLRVEGIPLVIPTGISLNVVKGNQTKWNPSGVYINGVIESASK